MARFFASRRARRRGGRDGGEVAQTLSQSSTGRHRPSTMERVFDLFGFKRSSRPSRHHQQQTLPSPQDNKTGGHHQEPGASSSMPMGTSGSHTGQRYQNALGLYIGNPSLQTVPSPQIASTTPTSSLLATPITPLPKGSLPDLPTSLHAELANAKSRIRFMEQNWVPKPEVEERVRALLMTRTAAEEQRKGFWSSMPEEEARVRERLERRIVELENEVRILKAKLRPVASFVDLRPKPQREHSDFSSLSRGDGFPMSPSTGSMNTDNLVDGVPSHGSLARVNNNNTTPSNRTSRRSMSMAQQTFGRHRGRSNTFGYSTMSGASQLEFPSRPTSGRHDSRKELTGPSSRTLLPPSQPQSETQQEAAGLAESTTSTAPDAATREVVTPTAEIEDLLRRLSIDHSVFLRPITSRPSTLVVASNIRERRERARSSAGYSSPSVYSEHFSLTQSRISPSPTPPSNLQGIDSVIGQRIQKPHAANAEPTDSSSSAPNAAQRERTAPEGPAQSTSLRLPAGDRSFVGNDILSQSASAWPTKSEQIKAPELRPPPRRLRSSVAVMDWTPPTEPQ